MTVRVERTVEFDVDPPAIWAVISDPENRADAISVVRNWKRDGDEIIWYLDLPIPFVSRTLSVRTRDVERDENERVRFVGRSKAMNVEGIHDIEALDEGSRLTNQFKVDGKLPGIERYFRRNIDDEMDNLSDAVRQSVTEE